MVNMTDYEVEQLQIAVFCLLCSYSLSRMHVMGAYCGECAPQSPRVE